MNQNCCGNSDRALSEIFKKLMELPLIFIVLIVIALICFVLFIGYLITLQNDKRIVKKRNSVEEKKLQ